MNRLIRRLGPALGLTTDDGTVRKGRQEVYESFVSGLVLQLLLLITGIIAARILGELGRGQQSLIWVIALITTQVAMFGLPLALTFEAARGRSTAKRLLSHIAPLAAAQIAGTLLIYLLVVMLVVGGKVPQSAALVTVVALPAMIWQSYCLALIQGHHAFRALHFFRILPSALYVIGLVTILLFHGDSVFLVMMAWTSTYVIAAVATQTYTWRLEAREPGLERQLPQRTKLVRFGAAGFLGSSAPLEVFRVDQLMVGLILKPSDLALYTTALAICNLPRFLTQALGMNAYAKIAAQTSDRMRWRLARRYTVAGIGVAVAVSVPLAAFAGPLINLTFGPEFIGAAEITQTLLVATVILCARRILSDCLRGIGLPGAGSMAEVASLISLAPAAAILVSAYGLEGFALAMIVSYAVGLSVSAIYMVRNRHIEPSPDAPEREGEAPPGSGPPPPQ